MVIDPNFWKGKQVLVTGHTGFKGGWLSLWLQSMGATVIGYSLDPKTQPNLFELGNIAHGMTSIIGNIQSLDTLKQVLTKFRPEIVFHLAAQPLVRESYKDPINTYATNVMGTVHLLEAVRDTESVCVVVNITSDKCYENREWVWAYREAEALGGYDPYSSSKACAELVAAAYRSSYFKDGGNNVALATARAGNVIGGGDWSADRLVPDCLRAFQSGQPVKLRSPYAVRPWQHVLEPLSGYILLAEKLMGDQGYLYTSGWNFGPDDRGDATVGEVAKTIAHLWGDDAQVDIDTTKNQPHEAGLLRLDISRVRAELGWRPRWTVKQALQATVDWHRAWICGKDMRDYSLSQISNFQRNELNGNMV
ncbi:CDP-glucose 4,6-dehydratase [Cylindrospermopsis raciborskii]|uniref:CDP-glucose 4,6-dehydratase n=1 Tax=Cylindrospermopsis raciborskii TaxID=77022 RepID=UPI00387A14DF